MKNNRDLEIDPGPSEDDAEILYDDDSPDIDFEDLDDAMEIPCEDHAYFRSG